MINLLQIISVVLSGLVAGVMFFYFHTLMRGLKTLDDQTFVKSFRAIDAAIINPLFLVSFLGGFIVSILSAVNAVQSQQDNELLWILAAALYTGGVLITFIVHVPRNNAIKSSPSAISTKQSSQYRKVFNENYWTVWHVIRTILFVTLFVVQVYAVSG